MPDFTMLAGYGSSQRRGTLAGRGVSVGADAVGKVEAAFTVGVQRNGSQEQRAAVASFGGHTCPRWDASLLLGSVLRRR